MFALKVMVKLEILDLGRVEVPSPLHLAVCHELDQLYWMSFYPGDALVSFPEHLVLRVYVPPPRPLLPLLRIPSLNQNSRLGKSIWGEVSSGRLVK